MNQSIQLGANEYSFRWLTSADANAQAVLAWAYQDRLFPRCLCKVDGPSYYIARRRGLYYLARMPGSYSDHAADCPAINPPISRTAEQTPTGSGSNNSREEHPLDQLLLAIWHASDLCLWSPHFEGRRIYPIVASRLRRVLEQLRRHGLPLAEQTVIPPTFDNKNPTRSRDRQRSAWKAAVQNARAAGNLPLALGLLRSVESVGGSVRIALRHAGPRFVLHAEDTSAEQLWPLAALSAANGFLPRPIAVLAEFSSSKGRLNLHSVSTLPLTQELIPAGAGTELRLVEELVALRRTFRKLLPRLDSQYGKALCLLEDTDPHTPLYLPSGTEMPEAGWLIPKTWEAGRLHLPTPTGARPRKS